MTNPELRVAFERFWREVQVCIDEEVMANYIFIHRMWARQTSVYIDEVMAKHHKASK